MNEKVKLNIHLVPAEPIEGEDTKRAEIRALMHALGADMLMIGKVERDATGAKVQDTDIAADAYMRDGVIPAHEIDALVATAREAAPMAGMLPFECTASLVRQDGRVEHLL